MPVGSGISSQLAISVAETTVGTAAALSRFYRFNTETLDLDLTRIDDMGLSAGALEDHIDHSVQTTRSAKGGFTINAPTKGLGLLAQHLLASYGQTLATPTQIGATGAYKQVHVPGLTTGKTWTIQKGVPQLDGTVQPYTYVGCKATEWTLACEAGGKVTLAVTVDAMDELTLGTTPASPALAVASYLTGGQFHFKQGTLLAGGTASTASGLTTITGGTALAKVRSISISRSRPLYVEGYYFGNAGIHDEAIENAMAQTTGTATVDFLDRTKVYDLFRNNTTTALQLSFVGDAGSAGTGQAMTLDIILPAVKFNGDTPKVSGPDIVSLTAPFKAYESTGNPSIQWTIISSDSVL